MYSFGYLRYNADCKQQEIKWLFKHSLYTNKIVDIFFVCEFTFIFCNLPVQVLILNSSVLIRCFIW